MKRAATATTAGDREHTLRTADTRGEATRRPCVATSCATFRAVVVGGSAGGFEAVAATLGALPPDFPLPVLVVQHLHASDGGRFAEHLGRAIPLPVVEPCDKEPIECGRAYTAPANYHMLVERDGTISLSIDARVNWSRPAIDVLFESAARAWSGKVIAVVLSGANRDGAEGMRAVRAAGGMTFAQNPETAASPTMPQAAIEAGVVDEVLGAVKIGRRLVQLAMPEARAGARTRQRDEKDMQGVPK